MIAFLPDTNYIIASISPWHPQHSEAADEINRRLDDGQEMVVAAHSLAEAYSVLTRLPPGQRRSPAAAWSALMESFARGRRVAALKPVDYVGALQRAADHGISGGRVYDLLIAECARLAGVDALLTFNHRHFVDLAQGVEIFVPNPEV